MSPKVFVRAALPLLSCAAFLLAGCNLQSTGTLAGPNVQGNVHGGQQPIVGAHVFLFAAGTGGYGGKAIAPSTGNASTSMLTSAVLTNNSGRSGKDGNNYYVTTDSAGSFSITNDYACTSGQQLYLYAVGGNPGAGANSAAGLLAALGDCSTLTANTYIFTNEVSTIAAAYALAGFASDATHISSSGTALAKTGIANAFKNAGNLAVLATGTAVNQYGTFAAPRVNYLANVIASCINSTGSTSAGCSGLLPVATSDGSTSGTHATDTATAAIYIAQNPGANVATLYSLPTPNPPFPASLSPQPTDWTLALQFTGGNYGAPAVLAVDASGDIWTANYNNHSLSEFSSTGVALSSDMYGDSTETTNNLASLAIESTGNVWTANNNTPGELYEFGQNGGQLSSETAGGTAFNNLTSMAFAPNGTLFATGGGGLINAKAASATAIPSPRILNQVAVDPSGTVWATDSGVPTRLYKYSAAGNNPVTYTGGNMSNPSSIAIDAAGSVWSTSPGGSVTRFVPTDAAPSAISGVSQPRQIAFDGTGSAWVVNSSTLYQLDASGNVLHSFTGGGLNTANSVAVDGSGNVWVSTTGGVIEFLGVGSPTVTPIVANLLAPYTHAASAP